jgi:hypothetical protein
MALYGKLGGALFGVATLGLLTVALRPGAVAITTLIGTTSVQSNLAQISEPVDDSQTETTGSLSESALRDAARRRLALALLPKEAVDRNSTAPLAATSASSHPIVMPTATKLADDESELHKLASKAEQSISDGDIIGARLLLDRATRAGDGKTLFMLAQTYDPQTLSRLGVQGIVGDADVARNYYNRALSAGFGEARERLSALPQ